MASFLSGDSKVEADRKSIKLVPTVPVPYYSDIAKSANDILNKDFYHIAAANLEVKSKAPNGVNFTVKGKSAHEGPLAGSLEAKKTDKPNGIQSYGVAILKPVSIRPKHHLVLMLNVMPLAQRRKKRRKRAKGTEANAAEASPEGQVEDSRPHHSYLPMQALIQFRDAGITGTVSWSTTNTIDGKIELDDTLAKNVKVEGMTTFKPQTNDTAAKVNFYFKQPAFVMRAFVDAMKGPTANVDAVIGHEGLVAGAEAGYDVQKAAVTKYSASVGYLTPEYCTAVTATNNLSIFTASYFHKVNSQVQMGAKTVYDSKNAGTVSLEVAGKYVVDPMSFVKGKVNDRGIAAVSYNTKVNSGFTLGLGASFDTQKLNEGSHKVGANFSFEG